MGRNDSCPASPQSLNRKTSGVCDGVFIQGVQVGEGVSVWGVVSAEKPLSESFN